MKSLLLSFLLLSLLSAPSYSQGLDVIRIDSLPSSGIAIDKGWKFHGGDDSAWANPDFNDQDWKTVDLSRYESEYFADLKKTKTGWFRIRLYLDSSLRSHPLALVISQLGASDLYLDGRILLRLGRIEGKMEPNNPHNKPFLLQGNLAGDTIALALRFASSYPRFPWLFTREKVRPLSFSISPWTNALNDYQTALVTPRYMIGYSFMTIGLGLLFFLLYAFLPTERVNILFAGFCFMLGILVVCNYQLRDGNLDINAFGWMSLGIELVSKCLGLLILSIMALEVTRKISYFQTGLIFYIIVIDTMLSIFFGNSRIDFILGNLARAIFTLEIIRLTYLSLQQRKYIAGIVGIAASLLNIIYFLGTIFSIHTFDLFFILNNYILIIVMSLYVASKYTRNTKDLMLQIAQNRKLSEEKQQMLISQKETLEQQVKDRTAELSVSLQELKETQTQLIQSEKMASLGELTAGIAHEIQNPLNFVNNFSEVNSELIDEMQKELSDGNADSAKAIGDDIRQNLEKISRHGKRADSIVKGMLMHSRSSTGQKEPTDINALADEYFRLSYHGLRAKDKMFNATMSQELDPQIGLVSVVAPDIGRALLNLFNNAFYSVTEKKKKLGDSFEPMVSLSTSKKGHNVQIVVRDNGLGISPNLVDKIFNPFYTSKPAGQGTGLGLSMSYDIITKEHEGHLSVHTLEGEYAEFVIELPIPENP